jgi:hypothetical protein
MIFSADNPIFPFLQFISLRTKQPVRNVISYDTITGEGVVIAEKVSVIPHLNNATVVEFAKHAETGQLLKGYFKDSRNVQVHIKIPERRYEEFRTYIEQIMQEPEHIQDSEKIKVQIIKEYIDKRDYSNS